MVLDMATSAIAYFELVDRARRGAPCPSDVGFDAAGRETTDPAAILAGGAIRPFDRRAPLELAISWCGLSRVVGQRGLPPLQPQHA